MGKVVPKEGFVGVFSRSWKGSSEVSIKEVAEKRFLVCFANQLGVFWVQLHRISPLNMTGAAMKKVGGLLGSILEVDQVDGEDCVECFARVRVMMDIEQLFMRGVFVEFPEEGSKWINFCYEYIPEYCFFCGCLGHPSRTCMEKKKGALASDSGVEALRAYAGLEALEDICGRPLKSVMRRTQPQSSFGTWKEAGRSVGEKAHRCTDGKRIMRHRLWGKGAYIEYFPMTFMNRQRRPAMTGLHDRHENLCLELSGYWGWSDSFQFEGAAQNQQARLWPFPSLISKQKNTFPSLNLNRSISALSFVISSRTQKPWLPCRTVMWKTFNKIKITIRCGFVEETNRILAEIHPNSNPNDLNELTQTECNPNTIYTRSS
ncbi:hypothetical protein GBA52_025006 [Prunus armeniaca]|nr:hypothetical protein GBA52_025006 [Prunus armeniaca]